MRKSKPITRTSNTRSKSRPKSRPKDSFIKQAEQPNNKYKVLEAKCSKLAKEKNEIAEKYNHLLNSPLMSEKYTYHQPTQN